MEDKRLESAAAIGQALISIQLVEMLLDVLLRSVFPDEDPATVEELEREPIFVRHATLGRLVRRLRQRVELDPQFEEYLSRFVEDRNRFVHHLLETTPKGASEEEARRYYFDFSKQMLKASLDLLTLFVAKFISWHLAFTGEPIDEDTKFYIQEAEKWMGSFEQLFRPRGG